MGHLVPSQIPLYFYLVFSLFLCAKRHHCWRLVVTWGGYSELPCLLRRKRHLSRRMWMASAFCHLSSAAAASVVSSSCSFLSQTLVPKTLASSCYRRLGRPAAGGRRLITAAFSLKESDSGRVGTMIPEDVAFVLEAVYAAKPTPQVCLTTTGSGGQAVSWLLGVPGASACLLEASVPYSMAACEERMAVLATVPPSYCSREAAEGLARDAYARAIALCVAGSDKGPHVLPEKAVIGVGCTAAVASSRPKRGPHRCFVCAQTRDGMTHYRLDLAKGRRDRAGEDAAVSRVVLQAIAEAAGVPVPVSFKADHLFLQNATEGEKNASSHEAGLGDGSETMTTEVVPRGEIVPERDAIEQIVEGELNAALFVVPRDDRRDTVISRHTAVSSGVSDECDKSRAEGEPLGLRNGEVNAALPQGSTVILPGSYNPIHRGHLGLMEVARALHAERLRSGCKGHGGARGGVTGVAGVQGKSEGQSKNEEVYAVFEISVSNPDKGVLEAEEVRRRLKQFSDPRDVGWPFPVVVTRAPLFSEKAKLFPGCTFVVGADTAKRIIDPKYYGNSLVEMVAALAQIQHFGCSFIVGGRAAPTDGKFFTLEDVLEGSELPDSLRGMFHGLDEAAFREDLSSTSIRAGITKGGH